MTTLRQRVYGVTPLAIPFLTGGFSSPFLVVDLHH